MSPVAARLRIVTAALLFATGGAAIKGTALSGWQVAGLRSGVAALALALALPAARRGWSRRSWLVGLGYAGTMICFVLANKLTTAASTVFLQATAPLYLLLLAPWLLGEALRPRDLPYLAVLGLGASGFFLGLEAPSATAPSPLGGNLVAALAGLCWAFTLLGLRWLEKAEEGPAGWAAVRAVVCGNLLACLLTLPAILAGPAGGPADWLIVAYLGIFQVALAYVLLTRGLRSVPALEASLLLLVEPATSPLWAWWAHGERPGPWSLAGGCLILVATGVKSLTEPRR